LSETERPHRGEAALLTGLLAGQTLSEAARSARIAPNTARRILEQPRVRQALAAARGRAIEEAVTVLASQATRAAQALVELAEHATQEQVKLAAATRVVELALKGRDLLDVEERLAALEAQMELSAVAAGRPAWPTRAS
jgi:hypothetical protein